MQESFICFCVLYVVVVKRYAFISPPLVFGLKMEGLVSLGNTIARIAIEELNFAWQ